MILTYFSHFADSRCYGVTVLRRVSKMTLCNSVTASQCHSDIMTLCSCVTASSVNRPHRRQIAPTPS